MARKSGKQTGSKQSRARQSGSKQSRTRQTRTRQSGNRRSQTRKQGRRENEFMRRLGVARKNQDESFNYKGNTYVRKELETGMAVYGKQ